jgi:hypothetical protein
MNPLRTWALALLLAAPVAPALADGVALYGLTWGLTPAQLQTQGVVLTDPQTLGHLTRYRSQALPGAANDGELYTLVFDDTTGLVKIQAFRLVPADPTGEQGRDLFDRVTDGFSAHYRTDPLHTAMILGRDINSGVPTTPPPTGFYPCLADPQCGVWMQTYNAPNQVIAVLLAGTTQADTGLLTVAAEAKPEFDESLARNAALKPPPTASESTPVPPAAAPQP